MTREKIEAELKRLLQEKGKQEAKLRAVEKQLDRLVSSWKTGQSLPNAKPQKIAKEKRAVTVSPEERERRSTRMRTFWENKRKAEPALSAKATKKNPTK